MPKKEKPKAPPKKGLKYQKLYIQALPSASMYEKSYMHRKVVTHLAVTKTEFILTGAEDGHLKFWKKLPSGIEFVKHFISHVAPITSLAVSSDGLYAASASKDKTLKIYDVINFDMITIIDLGFVPSDCCWVHQSSAKKPTIAIASAHEDAPYIYIYDILQNERTPENITKPLEILKDIHRDPVILIKYNQAYNTVISIDRKGRIEYWDAEPASEHAFPANAVQFKYKTSTDLYEFCKVGTVPTSLEISKDGKLFATMGADRNVRIFQFETGKLYRVYCESLEVFKSNQKEASSNVGSHKLDALDDIDFGRRMAIENQLDKAWAANKAPPSNVIFDESGNFVLYTSMLGIKLVNIVKNKLVNIIGKVENSERFLSIALFQGKTRGSVATGTFVAKGEEDPTVFSTAFNKNRFYLFSKREPPQDQDADMQAGRDVYNEKPTQDEIRSLPKKMKEDRIALSAILRTTFGDIHITLFGDKCPKTVENFTQLAKNNYYNGVIFHRVIKSFMIQTGDPLGDGTGGTSIWGKDFEDEFHPSLRHDVPFTVSMANANAPNTNGSQFFITTIPCPNLDNKHTVFGRVTKGMEVVSQIERVSTDKSAGKNKPWEDIKIINVDVNFHH
uniref:peptidylprolyl isomerase n=1 Tax=Arcella intermedia TaxID=1963864 RepID=A0A6B2KZT4_9EUKA